MTNLYTCANRCVQCGVADLHQVSPVPTYIQVHIYRYVYTGANCQVHCAVADVSIDDMFVEDEAGDRNSGR